MFPTRKTAWAWAVSSAASWTKKRAVSEKRWAKSVLGHQYQAQPAGGDYIRDLFDRADMVCGANFRLA
jgi:hypothetical protein